MFKKLRIKFIAMIMGMLTLVLVLVFSGICYSEYQRSYNEVTLVLEEAINRTVSTVQTGPHGESGSAPGREMASGEMSSGMPSEGARPSRSSSAINAEGSLGFDQGQGAMGPQIGGRDIDRRSLTPVAVYTLDEQSTLTVIDRATTAYISEDVLTEASSELAGKADGNGVLGDISLCYVVRTVENVRYVSFADATPTNSWQSLALTLAGAGLGMLAVFFVISLFFSNWALKPVREAWDSQRQFVADASHELKTPLTVVLANASILLKHPEQTIASQSQWVESTQVEAERMQGLVNEMLELAQVESRAAVHHEPLDFSEIVFREALQFESVAFERGCAFDTDIADGLRANGDATRLSKLVSTLIENAFKYVDENGTVDLRLTAAGRNAQLSVKNTGSAISPEDLPHIFDRFYRTDKARTSGAGGFGLGLAIAREIAREHGGDIVAASRESEGTTFTFTMPLA